jgi:hypothetical protein
MAEASTKRATKISEDVNAREKEATKPVEKRRIKERINKTIFSLLDLNFLPRSFFSR